MRNLIKTSALCQRNALRAGLYFSPRLPLQPAVPFASTIAPSATANSRRYFITLPKLPKLAQLPNLLKPLSSSRHYKDRTLLKYSQQEFYDLVANVDDYHMFLPWCTHSKMSAPLPLGAESGSGHTGSDVGIVKGGGEVTVRHGELGIGFNSLQERYVSTVTCQEPWMVRAVSYDSKLFKELSTTWRFTPNVPKTTTLDATMDQEVQEIQLLTRPAAAEEEDEKEVVTAESVPAGSILATTSEKPSTEATPTSGSATTTTATQIEKQQPKHYFTAAAVFGEAALPRPNMDQTIAPSPSPSSTLPRSPSTVSSSSIPPGGQTSSASEPTTSSFGSARATAPTPSLLSPTPSTSLRSSPQKQVILQRTASPSNLATMKPSDYPSCWIDFEIEFEFASPVHASMSSLFFDQVSKEMLAAFVKRAEVLYGKR